MKVEFTKEMLEKAKTAKTVEELLEIAKTEGVEMTAEEAEKAFADLYAFGEIADEELDNVSGGCSKSSSNTESNTPKYKAGDKVYYYKNTRGHSGLPVLKRVDAVILEVLDKKYGYFYYKVTGGLSVREQELYS